MRSTASRRNYFLGRFMRHSGWYPDRVMRLYPRERFQYNDNLVHESLETQGAKVIELSGDLLHLTCRDFASFQRKQLELRHRLGQRAPSEGQENLADRHFHPYAGGIYENPASAWRRADGKQGWLLAVVNAQYTFNKYTGVVGAESWLFCERVTDEHQSDLSRYV
jgi:(heptosyl)LPS beta-1,4-glucosyltransferase